MADTLVKRRSGKRLLSKRVSGEKVCSRAPCTSPLGNQDSASTSAPTSACAPPSASTALVKGQSAMAPPTMTVAETEARKMKAANPAQYYRQNLGQLGFGDPEHALVQTLKELIDNSLDSCEVMGILPDIKVEISATEKSYNVLTNRFKDGGIRSFPIFRIAVEDNGCGIVKEKVAKCFGTVLYGSKFFSFKQSRGQQGIGAHAAIIYAQLTSLEPAVIITKTAKDPVGFRLVMKIDTERNVPVVLASGAFPFNKAHGTRVELMVAGDYTPKVESFIRELSLANPHADLKFTIKTDPDQEARFVHYKRAVNTIPPEPKEIKPHLLSMEPGALLEMASNDRCCRTAVQFLITHFVRISEGKAKQILAASSHNSSACPGSLDVEALLKAARECDLMRPPLDVLSPIGEAELKASLRRVFPDAEFIGSASRAPWSYRGVPFQVEVGVAYGGESVIKDCGASHEALPKSKVIRLGNKCPLIYDSKDCLLYKVVKEVNWHNYRLPQERGSLPAAPAVFVVSLTATKVPYTAPGKFAIAYHDEIREQLKLALQELGRGINRFISRRQRQEHERHRQSTFQLYAREAARDLSALSEVAEAVLFNKLVESTRRGKAPRPHADRPGTKKPSGRIRAPICIGTGTGASTDIGAESRMREPKGEERPDVRTPAKPGMRSAGGWKLRKRASRIRGGAA